jgi:hypothetical protein
MEFVRVSICGSPFVCFMYAVKRCNCKLKAKPYLRNTYSVLETGFPELLSRYSSSASLRMKQILKPRRY